MKYAGKPMGMWMLFHRSFTHHLTVEFGLTPQQAKAVEALAKPEYQRIIARLPAFEKGDRFEMNIVNCAMLCAYILNMPQRPEAGPLTDYYAASMMTPAGHEVVLPAKRQKQVYRKGHCRDAGHSKAARWRPQPVLLEHGSLPPMRTAAATKRALPAAASAP